MDERLAIVFEAYRYAVCWLCLALFLVFGFVLMFVLFTAHGPEITMFVAAQGGGLLLCLAIFMLHWRMKNPHI
ncbi:MAG: hypothetical protein VKJ04_01130 [Vampirovibrionales bacterium]|nr:hypothetical protein [Vampirovibrionales bacterium]